MHLQIFFGRVALRHTLGRGKYSVRGSIGRSAMILQEDPGQSDTVSGSAQKTIPATVTISGMVTMLRTVEISTVWTAYS